MNRYFKIKLIALCALATTLVASGAAQAETTFLTCAGEHTHATYAVDLANNTVDGHPATITPINIHWVKSFPENGSLMTYDIDRTTGAETYQGTFPGIGSTGVATATCTVGSAPATKF